MKARRRTGSNLYIGRYTTARHRFTPDQDYTPNLARSPTSPTRAFILGQRPLATPDIQNSAGGAVSVVHPLCWPNNAHLRASTGLRGGGAPAAYYAQNATEKTITCLPSANSAPRLAHAIRQHRRVCSVDRRGALGARCTQFTTSLANQASTVRREAATTLLGKFVASRTTGGAVYMSTPQPRDFCAG